MLVARAAARNAVDTVAAVAVEGPKATPLALTAGNGAARAWFIEHSGVEFHAQRKIALKSCAAIRDAFLASPEATRRADASLKLVAKRTILAMDSAAPAADACAAAFLEGAAACDGAEDISCETARAALAVATRVVMLAALDAPARRTCRQYRPLADAAGLCATVFARYASGQADTSDLCRALAGMTEIADGETDDFVMPGDVEVAGLAASTREARIAQAADACRAAPAAERQAVRRRRPRRLLRDR